MNWFQKGVIKFIHIFYPIKVFRSEEVPVGRTVFVCNHLSNIDTVFMMELAKKDLYLLAKKELFKNKLFGKVLKSFGGIPIDRENPDVKSVILATRLLKEDKKLLIFPEGTRNKTGAELLPIKGGSVIFAVKTKSPIVPVFINRKARLFRKTYMMIGKPFELSEYYDKKLTEQDFNDLSNVIRDKILEVKECLANKLSKKV